MLAQVFDPLRHGRLEDAAPVAIPDDETISRGGEIVANERLGPLRIMVATDAWRPQTNGVVHTYERIAAQMPALGARLDFVSPDQFASLPMPIYPEIRLALATASAMKRYLRQSQPHYVHVATEGPIGLAMRRACIAAGRPFTTSFHTRFPEYLSARLPVPESWGYACERWFHNSGVGTLVATPTLARELDTYGLQNLYLWNRGVDTALFRPRKVRIFGEDKVFLYVGRISVEKNIEAFLRLDLPGRKVVVGTGPLIDDLRQRYPDVLFTGAKYGEDLALAYASADVFVFPSRTDTFGNVMLEALASGVPVAAFPVAGPRDVVSDPKVGVLDDDLGHAARLALTCERSACAAFAARFSWQGCARLFLDNIVEANRRAGDRQAIGAHWLASRRSAGVKAA